MRHAGLALVAVLVASSCSERGPRYPTVTRTEVQLSHEQPLTEVDRVRIEDIAIEETERTATVTYLGGTYSCYFLDRVEVRYEAERVVITVYEGQIFPEDPKPNDDVTVVCTTEGIYKKVSFALSQPLDGRRLVDGACVGSQEPPHPSCLDKYS